MKTVKIFLGGGVKLLHGENESLKGYRIEVIDPVISQLNSQEHTKHLFISKDFSDLTRNVVKGKQQEVYNNYIIHDAHVALFILDGKIGNITKHEIDIAVTSTKKSRHPIVYIYGKNLNDNDELIHYLNQKGIYFQHFFDNRDLASKIKADLNNSIKIIDHHTYIRILFSVILSLFLCVSLFFLVRNYKLSNEKTIDFCSAQLYLMRYHDVNVLTGVNIFNDSLLSTFKYEDSVMSENDRYIYPIINNDSIITTTPPFFRLKLHNKHRNTIVLIEAKLEIENYVADSSTYKQIFIPGRIKDIEINNVTINNNTTDYTLEGFRHNIAYGETDDRYYFCVTAQENCSFRMRVRAKSQLGDYLYSNYIQVKYIR